VALADELQRAAAAAGRFAEPGEELAGVLAAEPSDGARVYLCAFVQASGVRSGRAWLALDDAGRPIASRGLVREAVSIAAMCEIAAEAAGGGDLAELRSQLVALRLTEQPLGVEEAEDAALELERAVGVPPLVATTSYLDAVGAAAIRLERALGDGGGSPFAAAMKASVAVVDALAGEVERGYKLPLDVSH
jgi:hypothetical protein